MNSHEEYLELCAASTAGELSGEEEKKLQEHLAVCASCRRAKQEFELTIQKAVPTLAVEFAATAEHPEPAWSVEEAEAAFFKRLETDHNSPRSTDREIAKAGPQPTGSRFTYQPSRIPWAQLWMPFAACALLAIALGIVAFRSGVKRGTDTAQLKVAAPADASLEEQISDFGHERSQLLAKLEDDDKAIKKLRRDVAEQSEEIKRLMASSAAALAKTQNEQHTAANGPTEKFRSERELAAAQTRLQELQAKADELSRQREDAAKHAEMLEAKVVELTQLDRERGQELDRQHAEFTKQQELLERDHDVRELMGARDLYVADIRDVNGAGTNRTYGRVFFTKGKSLIVYAFDLDAQPGVQNASTFQAWGRRGPDKMQALSLGIFYEDNLSKKRWVLKSKDPKTLQDIDAVFVTVEPSGGSHHPSGKQLLFAYLRIDPNHP